MEPGTGSENGHPLDFETAPKNPRKRPYVFDYGKAKSCDHPELRVVARGTNLYRCTTCNYAHWIQGAITWPLHWMPIQGMFLLQSFALEFGVESLRKVLTSPIGTVDGTEHKPPLPPGTRPIDAFAVLEGIEASDPDRVAKWNKFLLAPQEEQRQIIAEAYKSLPSIGEGEAGVITALLGPGPVQPKRRGRRIANEPSNGRGKAGGAGPASGESMPSV